MTTIDPLNDLTQVIRAGVRATFGAPVAAAEASVHRSEHADYQADVALALARPLKRSPRDVAASIAAKLPLGEILENAAVSGPGFINLTCRPEYLAGWVPPGVRLEHVAFGSVLGQDGKVLKTRAGEAVSLTALVEEAVDRAREIADQGSLGITASERARIAEMVGIGSVKYADLANDRNRDYLFSWNRMLAFDGNTAPYLMYAHARIRSILRKAQVDRADLALASEQIRTDVPAERALALELLELPSTLVRLGETLQPHRLCQHIFQVATAFNGNPIAPRVICVWISCPIHRNALRFDPSSGGPISHGTGGRTNEGNA